MATTTASLLVLFLVIAAGTLVGKASVRGLTLGSSAILFVALIVGHFGGKIPDQLGTIGMVLFVYCVGISAGPTFFRVTDRNFNLPLPRRNTPMADFGTLFLTFPN